jgi:hypothetical protein
MFKMKTLKTVLAAGVATFALAAGAQAATIIGLVDGSTLVMIDSETGMASGAVEVSGVDGLVGIDVRPADGMLYGVSTGGEIVTIDPATGAATVGATLGTNLPDSAGAIVDFNPMADRLRYMGLDGTNLRVHPDTGEVTTDGSLAFDAADMHAGETPAIAAAAYINSFGTPEATAMYDIDSTIVALIQQTSPNDGVLAAVGKLNIEAADSYAFDIQTTEDGTNTAWLAAGGTLYTVDLETGAATEAVAIDGVEGSLGDIAVWPEM